MQSDPKTEGGITTSELLKLLSKECPGGVSFEPMAMRLLQHKIPLESDRIEELQNQMFQLENGLWFSSEMVADYQSRQAVSEHAEAWLFEYGYFSVEKLFDHFCDHFSQLISIENFAAFLRHLGFSVENCGKENLFCFSPQSSLQEYLATSSREITDYLDQADGTLIFNDIVMAMPHLTAEVLEYIRKKYLPEIQAAEVGGVPCWCSVEAILLPDDFAEKMTTTIDTLVMLDERVSSAKLEFALNLHYRMRVRKEYALLDDDTFIRVCAKYYQGENSVIIHSKQSRVRTNDDDYKINKRMRSPNTRFIDLAVPIGAELIFSKDTNITCTVVDEINHVKYENKEWSISALAKYLLGVAAINGFRHFSYDGEILFERRLRLKKTNN